MSIRVGVRADNLSGREGRYRFHTKTAGTIEYEDLIERMARARTTLSKPDLLAALALLSETIGELVAEGYFVKTPFGAFRLCAVGAISSPREDFAPNRPGSGHGFRLRFQPERSFERGLAPKVKAFRDDASWQRFPYPRSIEALVALSPLRPGEFLRLRGDRLGFDPADRRQGLFLVPPGGEGEVRAAIYAEIRPKLLIALLPATVAPGEYAIAVRVATKAGNLREGRLGSTVSIRA